MELNEYQELITETTIYPEEIGVGYCVWGLCGEAGEIANKVKKMYRDENLLEKTTTSGEWLHVLESHRADMKAELGDVLWYVTALATEFELTLEEILDYNAKKLLDRKARGVLGGKGDNR